MKDIIKTFEDQKIRIQLINDNPYFCAGDIGKILALSNVYRNVKKFTKGCHTVTTLTKGGEQEVLYISEENLYRLIFASRKEESIKFQDWVFDDVLPSIRKTGEYKIPANLKKLSTENRKVLTDIWRNCGIEKKHHFIQLTLQEYKALGMSGKKKKDMTKAEVLLLSALESMEALKLFHDPKGDYYECRDSLYDTAKVLPAIENKEIV
ncbi:MAG: BRO family protein [Gammaproteobacteria bacterium]|nr:BRO family protein [Gammaproteobacteria bacterium]